MIQKVGVKRQASVTSPTFSSSVAEQALSCRVQTLMPGKEDGGNGKDNSPERQLVATSSSSSSSLHLAQPRKAGNCEMTLRNTQHQRHLPVDSPVLPSKVPNMSLLADKLTVPIAVSNTIHVKGGPPLLC